VEGKIMAKGASSKESPKWGLIDLMRWKLLPEAAGGGDAFLFKFKDAWVRHNRAAIKSAAAAQAIPPELLAGTAWIEVGGDPTFVDRLAFEVRSFDWSGPKWVDEHLTITKPPAKTSFGSVSIQLRTAAQTLGLDVANMSSSELTHLATSLEKDAYNLTVVAKHLRQLLEHDFPGGDGRTLTPEQIKVVGARYNRGMGLSLEQIRKNLSYGEALLKRWDRMTGLLAG
jgi:hypothetical protein